MAWWRRRAVAPPPAGFFTAGPVSLLLMLEWLAVPVVAPPPTPAPLPETCDVHADATRERYTDCCTNISYQAEQACFEYAIWAQVRESCNSWVSEAWSKCIESCGDCDIIAEEIRAQCIFSLVFLGDGRLVTDYCNETAMSFKHRRCPAVCEPLFNKSFAESCVSEEGQECMALCGNYNTCDCRDVKGTFGIKRCLGDTVVQGPMPGREMNHSCALTPRSCMHNLFPVDNTSVDCLKYRLCEPDLCIINNVKCVSPHQCLDDGTCDPATGFCFYGRRPEGYNCSDGLNYTVNDGCYSGYCVGTTDYCLLYNVTCEALNPCTIGGVCHPATGQCTYDRLPDATPCDDGRLYTVEDRCERGLCVGVWKDLCVDWGVVCEAPSVCYEPGDCDPKTGLCSEPLPAAGAVSCDDGDPATVDDTCVDGVCMGKLVDGGVNFLTVGVGACTDRDGNRMASYAGDVKDEHECELQCRNDPQCLAYGYQFPLCIIYGTVRTRAPTVRGREWMFSAGVGIATDAGDAPEAIAIEKAMITQVGQTATYCRRKGLQADSIVSGQEKRDSLAGKVDTFFDWRRLALFFLFMLVIGLMPLCCARCSKCIFTTLDDLEMEDEDKEPTEEELMFDEFYFLLTSDHMGVKRTFATMDVDADKCLDRNELKLAIKEAGERALWPKSTMRLVETCSDLIFDSMDADGSGTVTLKEFKRFISRRIIKKQTDARGTLLQWFRGGPKKSSITPVFSVEDDVPRASSAVAQAPKAALSDGGNAFLKLVEAVPWNVLGSQLQADGSETRVAPEPDGGTSVVDVVRELRLVSAAGPADTTDPQAIALYAWASIHELQEWPEDVVSSLQADTDAKFHVYGDCSVIHAACPDLADEERFNSPKAATFSLSQAYGSILAEFAASGLDRLRLPPLSDGEPGGPGFRGKEQMAAIVVESLGRGFMELGAMQQGHVLAAAAVELCCHSEANQACLQEELARATQEEGGLRAAAAADDDLPIVPADEELVEVPGAVPASTTSVSID